MRKAEANSIWISNEVETLYRESTKLGQAARGHKWLNVGDNRSVSSEKGLVTHNIASKGRELIFKIAKAKGGNAFVSAIEGHDVSRCSFCKHEAKHISAPSLRIGTRIRGREIGRIAERFHSQIRYEGLKEKTVKRTIGKRVFVRGVGTGWEAGTGWGVAPAVEVHYEAPKLEHYKGVVKSIQGDSVLVTVSSPGDWDRWEARIPLAAFDKFPEEGKEFSCTISVSGPDINVRASILPKRPPRSLKDFGIDKEELLDWASKIDL